MNNKKGDRIGLLFLLLISYVKQYTDDCSDKVEEEYPPKRVMLIYAGRFYSA